MIHLAARSGVKESWEDPKATFEANVGGTEKALDAAAELGCFFVNLNSCPYDETSPRPTPETAPLKPFHPYAESKIEAEKKVLAAVGKKVLKGASLRLFNVYGPGQPESFFIPRLLKQLKDPNVQEIQLRNTSATRDFIYLDDVISAIEFIARRGENGIFNVATGEATSLKSVIEMAQKIAKVHKPIVSPETFEANEILHSQGDIRKIESLGWHPFVELGEGLRRTWMSLALQK